MGNSRKGDNNGLKLWTLVLKGGNSFELFIEGSGAVFHDGRHSLHHIFCNEETINSVLSVFGGSNYLLHSEAETEEQSATRKLFHREDLEKVFPSTACPKCFWFDLEAPSMCGLIDWGLETQKECRQAHKKAVADEKGCPLRN